MQTAEQLVTSGVEELLRRINKLERIAELASQYKEVHTDKFASYNEKEYALEKLGESLEEYELFLSK
jgi:cytochrome c peroxidase|tara:strand:+ start:336 stop:536 length:201 start_codon:yes stop_codon:yes gene_type:complete